MIINSIIQFIALTNALLINALSEMNTSAHSFTIDTIENLYYDSKKSFVY